MTYSLNGKDMNWYNLNELLQFMRERDQVPDFAQIVFVPKTGHIVASWTEEIQ